jgi:hypothetical protein
MRLAMFAAMFFMGIVSNVLAEGAVAFGTTGDLAKDGFALGYATNHSTSESAKAEALKQCFEFKGNPKAAKHCKLVGTLSNECLSIHFDPEVGRPGVGWGIGPGKAAAEQRSLVNCQNTAGKNRVKFCQHNRTVCDGTAK